MGQKTAMISSTARDLPEYRRMVMDACLRLGFRPIMMDHLAGQDRSATEVSVGMVEDADLYLGIFAHAYGSNPDNDARSYTEIEFDKAVDLGITVIPFFVDEDVPWPPRAVDKGEKAEKLERLKVRVAKGRIVQWFKSPEDLRGLVVHALSEFEKTLAEPDEQPKAADFHPPNVIPNPPEPYIAHPYSLLQTKDVVGRQAELNLLTDWVTNKLGVGIHIFNVVAIGGMGKSALTWKWFNDIAPNELPNLAGRMWWSFYESDAHWENFVIRALAYVSGQAEKSIREMKSPEREDQLWQILDQLPFLLVLDGLERILLAYARMDAAQMLDEDLDDKTANRVAQAIGLPQSAADSFIGKHQLRMAADHRAGNFLRRLTRIRNSRILITTRLYPAELQMETGDPLPGCSAQFLTGLTESDALNLWREFKVSGSTEQLLPLFRSFGNYPLLIRALAGEVAAFRGGPGDFDKWRTENREFDPTRLSLKNAKTHVLEYALQGLKPEHRKVLHTIAAFRMPATWQTLRALLVEQDRGLHAASKSDDEDAAKHKEFQVPKPCATDQALDLILTELEDRGLVGWDKKANRYDMHPIVRGVVWQALDGRSRKGIYSDLHIYFDAVPRPPAAAEVESLEDLTPAIELYQVLIGLERYEDAFNLFCDHLEDATLYRLSASRQRAELLECLFPDGIAHLPGLQTRGRQTYTLSTLALTYLFLGDPGRAVLLCRRAIEMSDFKSEAVNAAMILTNLSYALRVSGALRGADSAAQRAIQLGREHENLTSEGNGECWHGFDLAHCGIYASSEIAFKRSLKIWISEKNPAGEGYVSACLAESLLWFGDPERALRCAERAWEMAVASRNEAEFIRAARLNGTAALNLNDLEFAVERLQHALTRARSVSRVEEELPTLTALAELHRRVGETSTARELLDQVWDAAERGPYPLFHADALNVLAQIERDQGNRDAAVVAATKAYKQAWCDGISADGKVCYAYHYGLTNARKHLQELGAPEPQLPPFDESKFEPLPDVELNPKDEFWVSPEELDSNP